MTEECTKDALSSENTDETDARGVLAGSLSGLSLTPKIGEPIASRASIGGQHGSPIASQGQTRLAMLLKERKQTDKFRKFVADLQRIDLVNPYKTARRGQCVLINEKEFDERATGQRRRDGTDVDADYVEQVFTALGFTVSRFNDLSVAGVRKVVTKYASPNYHTNSDVFVMIVLSHGVEGRIFASDGDLSIDADIIDPFRGTNCQSLVGKPKLFFIQACRGSRFDRGADATDSGHSKIPMEADILVFSSTCPGYFSWRNNQDGSWFIQSLCYVLHTYVIDYDASGETAPKSLDEVVALTKQIVAEKYESCTDAEWSSHMKQMPVTVSTLRKAIYLNPLPSKQQAAGTNNV